MTTFVGVMSQVARRELAAHRTLALGVVTESFTNEGGRGDHHLDCHVRLHGSELVLQHVPVAVLRPGLSAVPRKDDLVVVGFLDGDVNGPVLLGTIHAAEVPPPDARPDEVVYEVPDDGGSSRRFELRLPNGNTLTVEDDEVSISMGGTTVLVESGGAIRLEAGGDVTIAAGGSMTLEAQTDLDLKAGAGVNVRAGSSATLKSAMNTISGITSFQAG